MADRQSVTDATSAVDVMESDYSYVGFYDKLGSSYPETQIVYSEPLGESRRKLVQAYLRQFASKGFHLLDVGCNDGHYSFFYAVTGGRVHGIDISSSLIAKARRIAAELHLQTASFEVANIESYHGGPFDAVLFSEVLEHVRHPELALGSVADSLRPGGYLMLTTPAPGWQSNRLWRVFANRVFSEELVVPTTHRSDDTAIRGHVDGSFQYRHDEYYLKPLVRLIERKGFRVRSAGTFFLPQSVGRRFNRYPQIQIRIPVLNQLGLNHFHIYRKA